MKPCLGRTFLHPDIHISTCHTAVGLIWDSLLGEDTSP